MPNFVHLFLMFLQQFALPLRKLCAEIGWDSGALEIDTKPNLVNLRSSVKKLLKTLACHPQRIFLLATCGERRKTKRTH